MKWIKKVATTPIDAVAKVIDTLQTQTNERLNAPSIRAVRDGLADKWQDIYPIGSIYMSVNDTNPSLVFGGTWQQIKDRFLLACGDTYDNGQTGGVASNPYTPTGTISNHTLTIDEIPAHTHKIGTYDFHTTTGGEAQLGVTNYMDYPEDSSSVGGGQPHNHTFSGVSKTFDNMPPYLAVNVWVRTA